MELGNFRQSRPQGRLTLRQRAACVLLALLALAVSPAASAQEVSTTAQAQAAILTRGAMARISNMDFGVIAQPAVAGTVTLVPTLTATCSTSAGIIHTGACKAARFAIMFRKHDKNRVREMNGGTIVLTGPGGATMTVTNLTIGGLTDMTQVGTGGPTGTFGRYNIDSDSGIASFNIGGRLNVGANQTPGSYSGTLTMNVLLN
jgi:hypothetical protein